MLLNKPEIQPLTSFQLFIAFFFCLLSLPSLGQQDEWSKKGRVYLHWGWNRSAYTRSDIQFYGPGYNFTLHDVHAQDRPTEVKMEYYLHPEQVSVPQTNFQLGYYLSEHYSIAIGFDHMKYMMTRIQNVRMDGYIEGTETEWDGTYQNEEIELNPKLLTYEHSDGLNYLWAECSRHDDLVNLWDDRLVLELNEGLGGAALYPRTASRFLINELADDYHFAGYGFHGRVGLQILLFRYLSIQTNIKGGFVHLPDVVTSNTPGEGARQHFWFLQGNLLFGANIPLFQH